MNSLASNRKPICHFLLSLTCSSSKFIKVSLFSTSSSPPHSPSSYSSSRRFDEESRNVKVSVWWDIENCSVPTGINAFKIAQSITAAVRVNGIKGPVQISAFGDIFCISRPNQEALSSTGINLIHVPHGYAHKYPLCRCPLFGIGTQRSCVSGQGPRLWFKGVLKTVRCLWSCLIAYGYNSCDLDVVCT